MALQNPEIVIQEVRERHPSLHPEYNSLNRRGFYARPTDRLSSLNQSFTQYIPEWVRYLIITILGTIILGLPAIIIALSKDPDEFWPVNVTARFNSTLGETFRWSLLTSVTFGTYFGALSVITLIPVAAYTMGVLLNKRLLGGRVRDSLRHIMLIRHFFALPMAAFILRILVSILLTSVNADDTNLIGSSKLGEFYSSRSAFAILVLSVLLLLEKLITQKIAINYHYDYYADRIENNMFSLAAVSRLRKKYPPLRRASKILLTKSTSDFEKDEATDVAMAIFNGLKVEGRDYLISHDFEQVLTESDSRRFFLSLDRDGNGDLTVKEMLDGIQQVYTERDLLSQSLAANDQLVGRLDGLGVILVLAITAALCLPIFDVSFAVSLFSLISTAMAAKIFFDSSMVAVFTTIIFIFVSHPFDVGDVVLLDGKKFKVKNIGWWNSSFYGEGNTLVYMSNASLDKMYISNFRRSRPQSEDFSINVHFNTKREQLIDLEDLLNDFILCNPRDFTGRVMVRVESLMDSECMRVNFTVSHRSNFQSSDLRSQRAAKFMDAVRSVLSNLHIKLASEP